MEHVAYCSALLDSSCVGVVAAVISAFLALYLPLHDLSSLIDSFTVALLIYLASYYPLKAIYSKKIEKQSKILSTAVAMILLRLVTFLRAVLHDIQNLRLTFIEKIYSSPFLRKLAIVAWLLSLRRVSIFSSSLAFTLPFCGWRNFHAC